MADAVKRKRPRSPSPSALVTLFCFLVGTNATFPVDIPSSSTVGHLKKSIQREKPHRLGGIDADELELFGISEQSGPNLADRVKDAVQGAVPLNPTKKIRDLFPDPPEETIHIAVKLPDDAVMDQLDASPGSVFQLRERFFKLNPSKAPSSEGKPAKFAARQKNSNFAVDCGRPANRTSLIPPILYNEILNQFANDLHNSTPTALDFQFYRDMAEAFSAIFLDEATRMTKFRDFLEKVPEFEKIRTRRIQNFETDGSLLTVEDIMHFFLEGKNEMASTEAEPFFQIIQYYQEMVRVRRLTKLGRYTDFPAILLLHFGSHLEVAVAVFHERPNVQVLSPVIALHSHPTDLVAREAGARFIYALRTAVSSLNAYYSGILALSQSSPSAQLTIPHPWPTSYHENDQLVEFQYKAQQSEDKRVFFARCNNDVPLCIKFTQRYGEEAHRAAAALGIAPKLKAVEKLPAGWFMVVMEDVQDEYETCYDAERTAELKEKVFQALQKLHNKGYVHGDVRDVNVMFSPTSSQVLLVDFDWSGESEKVKYPSGINMSIPRPPSVAPDGPITSQHDLEMLNIVFPDQMVL